MVTNALLRPVSIPTVISAVGCKQDLGPLLAGTVKASESLTAQFPTGHLNSNELFPATADYSEPLQWRGHNKSFLSHALALITIGEVCRLFSFNELSSSHFLSLCLGFLLQAASLKTNAVFSFSHEHCVELRDFIGMYLFLFLSSSLHNAE